MSNELTSETQQRGRAEETETPPVRNNNPLAQEAYATYRAHLPRLLEERPGQWVAYHGSRLVGFAKTDLELYRKCDEQNIPEAEYIVYPIEEIDEEPVYLDRP